MSISRLRCRLSLIGSVCIKLLKFPAMSASYWFFLQKSLQRLRRELLRQMCRLILILFAEKFALTSSISAVVPVRLILILFAEKFARLHPTWHDTDRPPHTDSFCRKVCRGLVHQQWWCSAASYWFFLQKSLPQRHLNWSAAAQSASYWFFLQKSLQDLGDPASGGYAPPHTDSFCRKVCSDQCEAETEYAAASYWFFLQKSLPQRHNTLENNILYW